MHLFQKQVIIKVYAFCIVRSGIWSFKERNKQKTIFYYIIRKLIRFVFCLLLRFLFYKDSAPYKQYEALIEQFKKEITKPPECDQSLDNSGEKYEPEMALEDDSDGNRCLRQRDNTENEV